MQLCTLDGEPFEIPGTTKAVPRIAAVADAFRASHRPIIHVIRLYHPDGSNAELCRCEPLRSGAELALVGSEGRMPVAAILPADIADLDDTTHEVTWLRHPTRLRCRRLPISRAARTKCPVPISSVMIIRPRTFVVHQPTLGSERSDGGRALAPAAEISTRVLCPTGISPVHRLYRRSYLRYIRQGLPHGSRFLYPSV